MPVYEWAVLQHTLDSLLGPSQPYVLAVEGVGDLFSLGIHWDDNGKDVVQNVVTTILARGFKTEAEAQSWLHHYNLVGSLRTKYGVPSTITQHELAWSLHGAAGWTRQNR